MEQGAMAIEAQAAPRPPRVAFHNNPKLRGLFYQAVLLAAILWIAYELVNNARENLQARGFVAGLGFLQETAGFGINQSLIAYSESDTYGRVFLVGLLNTLLIAVLGIVFATLIGFVVGIGRLSRNWLIARLAGGYVELIRNQPLLFQILFWYLAVLGSLPLPRQSIGLGLQPILQQLASLLEHLIEPLKTLGIALAGLAEWIGPPEIYLNNRGLIVPRPVFGAGAGVVIAALVVGILATIGIRIWAKRRQMETGRQFPLLRTAFGLIIGVPLLLLIALGFPISFEAPELRGFNFVGGVRLLPEFVALLIALSTYTAAFIAEIVRAGILAVPRGQTEAAYSLGLRSGPTLRLVIVPQALRVIIPPLTSQYLNLTKNSSLAVAIGYPDLFAVFAGTTLNQSSRHAIEIVAITMAVYLTISLLTSALMNWYNARVALEER